MQKENQNKITKKTTRKGKVVIIALHITAWLVLIVLPHFIINNYWGNNNFVPLRFYFNVAIYGLIFYINYIWLVPRFFLRRKKTIYFASSIAVIVVMYLLNSYFRNMEKPVNFERFAIEQSRERRTPEDRFFPKPPMEKDFQMRKGPPAQLDFYFFLLSSVIITGFSIGLKVIEQHGNIEKRQQELEKEKLNSELAFLKNQVSPHFFFNTLNNIYSLVEINIDDAQTAILKLSKLMRYLLYESESGLVNLNDELNFMNNYIDLMRLRLSKKVDVFLEFPNDILDHKIPPLLFVPFVENAFKHGVSYREKSFIKIEMKTIENKIFFLCANRIGKTPNREIDKSHSGIGLMNVKKRLALLFPGKHILNIETRNETFTVSLEIDLK